MNFDLSYVEDNIAAKIKEAAQVNHFLEKVLGSQVLEHAVMLPGIGDHKKIKGGVVSENGTFIRTSGWFENDKCEGYEFDPSSLKYRKETVIYIGYFNATWGHALTDNLKKLWYLATKECQEQLSQGAKFVYITKHNRAMPDHVFRLFELAGFDLHQTEHITEPTRFERIVVPDNSFIVDEGPVASAHRYFTKEFKDTIEIIKRNAKKVEASFPEKIYFTRTKFARKRELGEENIERVFKQKGYAIISPEQHSVDEQIQMMLQCNSFASTEGSVSHNSMFCKPGTEVVLIRKVHVVNNYQMAINQMTGIRVTYIDANNSIRAPKEATWLGPYYFCVNKHMKKWAGISTFVWPWYLSVSWCKYLLRGTFIHRVLRR